MDLLSIILLGIGLSVDSFTVSVTAGVCSPNIKIKSIFKVASCMAFFQALMPLVGWFVGIGFKSYIESIDHWVAFFLLLLIGCKMIFDSFGHHECDNNISKMKSLILMGMALATSIDALVVGVSFGVLQMSIWFPVLIIGLITFICSFIGVWIGYKIGNKFNSYLEFIGGALLVSLGFKILLEHTVFI